MEEGAWITDDERDGAALQALLKRVALGLFGVCEKRVPGREWRVATWRMRS